MACHGAYFMEYGGGAHGTCHGTAVTCHDTAVGCHGTAVACLGKCHGACSGHNARLATACHGKPHGLPRSAETYHGHCHGMPRKKIRGCASVDCWDMKALHRLQVPLPTPIFDTHHTDGTFGHVRCRHPSPARPRYPRTGTSASLK